MALGKLYTHKDNPRGRSILLIAKANNLELEVVEIDRQNVPEDYKKINKLGKIPTFVGADGYILHECLAIAIYVASQNEKTTLLGKTKQDYASILKWMSYMNSDIVMSLSGIVLPLIGLQPYNKKAVEDCKIAADNQLAVFESFLLDHTYLGGERISLADLFCLALMQPGFDKLFGTEWRSQHPNITRWYETVYNQPANLAISPKLKFIDQPVLTNTPPKKNDQPKQTATPKPSATKSQETEEDGPPPEPKPKHPLDLLPRATFALDEWKRQYSNSETPEALKWFWENVNFEEYSLWKVAYKYNDELTMTFMSNNLIGGFNNRLEASRKHLFGCASVFGENNDSVIQGAFVIRGDDWKPVFDVAPDYESYEFSKLSHENPQDKAFLESMWSWDKPAEVAGKQYPHASGKVFK